MKEWTLIILGLLMILVFLVLYVGIAIGTTTFAFHVHAALGWVSVCYWSIQGVAILMGVVGQALVRGR